MRELGTGKTGPTVRLIQEIDRRRRRLAQRFVEATSVTERFAISRELGTLLERRRVMLRSVERSAVLRS